MEVSAFDGSGLCARYDDGKLFCKVDFLPNSIPISPVSLSGVVSDHALGKRAACVVIEGAVQCVGGGAVVGLPDGQIIPFFGQIEKLQPVTMVRRGFDRSCVRTNEGLLRCWGRELSGIETHDDFSGMARFDSGYGFHCAVGPSGLVTCSGSNNVGQLGSSGGTELREVAVGPARDIVTNYESACALQLDGEVWCWGRSRFSSLGSGVPAFQTDNPPTRLEGLSGIIDVDLGVNGGCAVDLFGQVYCWGLGEDGQLGDGLSTNSATPVAVSLFSDIKQIAVGRKFACALRLDGTVWCWGDNTEGQLGLGDAVNSSPLPQQLSLSGVTQISAGDSHVCALDNSGRLSCWGGNLYGQVGAGVWEADIEARLPITQVGQMVFETVSASGSGTCALSVDGKLYCWGDDSLGQVNDNAQCVDHSFSTSVIGFSAHLCDAPALVQDI